MVNIYKEPLPREELINDYKYISKLNKKYVKQINELQQRIDKAIEYIKGQQSFETYQHLKTIYDDIDSTEEVWEDYDFKDILNILKGSEE